MPLSPTYLCGLAAAAYVTTCLVAAAVRWFHMCRPFDQHAGYYYPGRPAVTGSWLTALALLPYVFHPESADAWFLTRLYFLPVTLFHFTLILFAYFGSVMQWKKWRWPALLMGLPLALALLGAVVLALVPEEQIGGTRVASFVLYSLGGIITAVCFASITAVLVWASRFDPDDYSNPADFPVTQARRWLVLILVNTALCWTGALMDSPGVLAVIQLIIAVSAVLFVITALHPNRNRPVEEPSSDLPADEVQTGQRALSGKKGEEILSAIRKVVEGEEAFLDSHLTLQDVAQRCGYNRTYISGLVKSELGGFAAYVNRLRLAYVDDYLSRNPGASLSEAIDAAGFGSRQTYYAVRGKQEE